MSKQAVFFVNHWPEPQSSAAGLRTYETAHFLQRLGYALTGICPGPASLHSAAWEQQGVHTLSCDPNKSEADEILKNFRPELVFYDRFYMEEQFGWRARELWPEALHAVDTSDLHCLRRARQKAAALNQTWPQIIEPDEELYGEDILRELSSLHRADITLVVSSYEAEWLCHRGLEPERILYLPFSARAESTTKAKDHRKGFCFLGNFLHAPNLDAVKWLEHELWPQLRKQLPSAELHLYGAYPPAAFSHYKGKSGIFSHGAVEDHRAAISRHEVMVAPLRFGAGIKGKVLEAWATGTPVLGTPMAFEGICADHRSFLNATDFVEEALRLQDEKNWEESARFGKEVLHSTFEKEILFEKMKSYLPQAISRLPEWRNSLTGRMLRHHGAQSLKYFSRWIEEKNKNLDLKDLKT